MAVVTLAVRVPEEYVVGKQDGASCNRDVGVPEEEVDWKQDGAGCNGYVEVPVKVELRKEDGACCYQAYGGSEEDVVEKQMVC